MEPVAKTLPAAYYLDNFHRLMGFVADHYRGLLNADERRYYEQFCSFSDSAQKIYVRMLLRKGTQFRAAKLRYEEIEAIDAGLEELSKAGFLTIARDTNLQQIIESGVLGSADQYDLQRLFTKSELAERFPEHHLSKMNRDAIDYVLMQKPLLEVSQGLLEEEPKGIVLCHHSIHFKTYRLLFFGNLFQDMSEFVLQDLGLYQFEAYSISPENSYIKSRDQLNQHLAYYDDAFESEFISKNDEQGIVNFLERVTVRYARHISQDAVLQRRVQRLVYRWARQLERQGNNEQAASYYRFLGTPEATERLLRLYFNQGEWDKAFNLAEGWLSSEVSESETTFLSSFIPRQVKALRKSAEATDITKLECLAPRCFSLNGKAKPKINKQAVTLNKPQGNVRVEYELALYLSDKGTCYYVENALVNSVFGLAMWEIIFADIPGAFYNPFQYGPADLHEGFYQNRKSLIEAYWHNVTIDSLREKVFTTYKEKYGVVNPFVYWSVLSEELLELSLARIPLIHWLAMFKRILSEPKANRSGLPDLVLFPKNGDYVFVEVKGPGDKLQANQLRWLSHFDSCSIPYQVVDVQWA